LKVQCIHGVNGLTEDEIGRTFTCSPTSSSSGAKSKPCAWDEKNRILRIKNHVLAIKKLFLRALKSEALGKEKKKECTILSLMLG
jgi:hypothetical protein